MRWGLVAIAAGLLTAYLILLMLGMIYSPTAW